MIKVDIVTKEGCTPRPDPTCPLPPSPSVDPRCEDPLFRQQNPGICKGFNRLIIKPSQIILCNLQSVSFKAFLVADGKQEVELTSGVAWRSSDLAVVQVSGTNGQGVGVGMGIANVSATWQDLEATASVTVLPECCADRQTGIVLLIDRSDSMNQKFSALGGTKLAYAKKLAYDYVGNLNLDKDLAAIMSFGQGGVLVQDFTDSLAALQSGIASIPMGDSSTDIGDSLQDAIALLDGQVLDTKVVIILTDGQPTGFVSMDPNSVAEEFKSRSGFILGVGIRAFDDGFDLLEQISTAGFFINAHHNTEPFIPNWLGGLSGYFCAGNCVPAGDVVLIGRGKLNYTGFLNWDVAGRDGVVDLIGGDPAHPEYDLFNLLPGNGLYVDLKGTPGTGGLRTKNPISFISGNAYHFNLWIAGNQRNPGQSDFVRVKVLDAGLNEIWGTSIGPIDPYDDFAEFELTFTPSDTFDGHLEIDELPDNLAWGDVGALLDRVVINEEWLSTDSHVATLLDDNFDSENGGLVPPECPDLIASPNVFSPTLGGYGSVYDCPGYGCLLSPIPAQVPDPFPLPADLEGTIPGNSPEENAMSFNPAGKFVTREEFLRVIAALQSTMMAAPSVDYLGLAGGTMQGAINMGAFTLAFGGDSGFFCVFGGHAYIKNPSVNQWHRFRTFSVDGQVLADIDQTPLTIDFSDIATDPGAAPFMPLGGASMAGGIDLNGFTLAFGAGDFVIFQGAAYFEHPTLNQWHKLITVAVEGSVLLDIDQTPTSIDLSGIPTSAGISPYLALTGGTMQGPINMSGFKLTFGSGSFAVYLGHAYLKSASHFYRLSLTLTEGILVLDLKQTPTTIP